MSEMMHYVTQVGRGQVRPTDAGYRLTVPTAARSTYHNAQISTHLSRAYLQHKPPLTMRLRAHAEGHIYGTAGFGFWNQPFAPGERGLRLPKAVWFFFGAPPNDMPLALDVPGFGWKTATFDAANARFLSLLPAAPLGFLLMRVPALYRALWPVGQRALTISESWLGETIPSEPHDYALCWEHDHVRFWVDDELIHEAPASPRGPLGFVAWVDNQYAVVTPTGRFRFGVVDVHRAGSLVIENLEVC